MLSRESQKNPKFDGKTVARFASRLYCSPSKQQRTNLDDPPIDSPDRSFIRPWPPLVGTSPRAPLQVQSEQVQSTTTTTPLVVQQQTDPELPSPSLLFPDHSLHLLNLNCLYVEVTHLQSVLQREWRLSHCVLLLLLPDQALSNPNPLQKQSRPSRNEARNPGDNLSSTVAMCTEENWREE